MPVTDCISDITARWPAAAPARAAASGVPQSRHGQPHLQHLPPPLHPHALPPFPLPPPPSCRAAAHGPRPLP
eukprot:4605114-Prymnesium_polylepis.1